MDLDEDIRPQNLSFQTSPRAPSNDEVFGGTGDDRGAEVGMNGDLGAGVVGEGVKPIVLGLEGGVDLGVVLSRVFTGLKERRMGGGGEGLDCEGGFSALFVVHVDRREELKGVGAGTTTSLPSRAPVKVVSNNGEIAKCMAYLPLFDGKEGWKEPGVVFVLPGMGGGEEGEMDRRLVKGLVIASSSRERVCVWVENRGGGGGGGEGGWGEGWEVWKG